MPQIFKQPTINNGWTGSKYKGPLYPLQPNFFLRLNTTKPLVSGCLGNKELIFVVSIEISHKAPLSLDD